MLDGNVKLERWRRTSCLSDLDFCTFLKLCWNVANCIPMYTTLMKDLFIFQTPFTHGGRLTKEDCPGSYRGSTYKSTTLDRRHILFRPRKRTVIIVINLLWTLVVRICVQYLGWAVFLCRPYSIVELLMRAMRKVFVCILIVWKIY